MASKKPTTTTQPATLKKPRQKKVKTEEIKEEVKKPYVRPVKGSAESLEWSKRMIEAKKKKKLEREQAQTTAQTAV